MAPNQTPHESGRRGAKRVALPLPTSMAPQNPGSFTPKRYWKKLSCMKSSSRSVSYSMAVSPPCSSTTAPSATPALRRRSHRRRRLSACMDMGTTKVPGPIENAGSLWPMAELCARGARVRITSMDYRDLAQDLLALARTSGADAADLVLGEGTDFTVTVRKGEVETLKEAGSKALGIRVFVGKRSASSYTSDFSPAALRSLIEETVAMARVTGEDPAAGLPDEVFPAEDPDPGLFEPAPAGLSAEERIARAKRAEAAAFAASPLV